MSGPPKDISASELWLKLSSAERPSQLVDFPRRDAEGAPLGQLAIRILTQEEQMICSSAAEEVARKHLKEAKRDDLGYERLFSDAVCVEVLFRACRDANDQKRPAFPSPKHLREALTTEECGALFRHYLTVQLELGPSVLLLSDADVEAWIDRLVEGGSAFPFDLLSTDMQKLVLLHMAYQLRSSPESTSSAGMPPNDTLPSSDENEKPPEADE